MGGSSNVNHKGRAAVLVIDNQTGFLGIPADVMNDIGERVFGDLLRSNYDEVIVVKAHDKRAKDNEVARAMKQAAARYGSVDMFVDMHTNMSDGELAQVPFDAFLTTLTEGERDHLRVLYNMGCGDGNPISAIAAAYLGFRTFVGHVGSPSASPIFAYPFLVRWLDGDQTISEAANSTYSDLKKATAVLTTGAIDNWDVVQKGIGIINECSTAESGKETPSMIEVGTCAFAKAGSEMAAINRILTDMMATIPEAEDFVRKYAGFILGSVARSGIEMPDILKYAAGTDKNAAKTYIDKEFGGTLDATKPYISGADIKSDDAVPKTARMRREETVSKLCKAFGDVGKIDLREIGVYEYQKLSNSAHNIVMLLGRLGAVKELEGMVDDTNLEPARRFIAMRALLEVDPKKYYPKFKALLQNTMDTKKEGNERYSVEARNQTVWITENPEVLKVIELDPDVPEYLKVESTARLIHLDAVDVATLSKIATNKGEDLFLRRVAAGKLMDSHFEEGLPALKTILGDVADDQNIRADILMDIMRMKKTGEFLDVLTSIVDLSTYADLTDTGELSVWNIYDQRSSLIYFMYMDAPDALKAVCRRLADESKDQVTKVAACLYLYDAKDMSDDEFEKRVSHSREYFNQKYGGCSSYGCLRDQDHLADMLKSGK